MSEDRSVTQQQQQQRRKTDKDDSQRTQQALRIIGVVSSIVGLVSFALFIVVNIRNHVLEQENKRRTEQFLRASERFTATLNSKESQLRKTTDRLEMQAKVIGDQTRLLQTLERKIDLLDAKLMRGRALVDGGASNAPQSLRSLWDL